MQLHNLIFRTRLRPSMSKPKQRPRRPKKTATRTSIAIGPEENSSSIGGWASEAPPPCPTEFDCCWRRPKSNRGLNWLIPPGIPRWSANITMNHSSSLTRRLNGHFADVAPPLLRFDSKLGS